MSTTFTTSMFDRLKTAMNTGSQGGNNKYKDILKLSVGNIYTVRLIPNLESPENTFFHYYTHAWESFSTGQYISALSPQTWGEKDPIAEARYTLSKHGTDEEKEKAGKIIRRENWLANVYVVSDPTNPANDGQVRLLRFGKQLHKIIMEAIEGDDADEFGAKIFDLTATGCAFKVKCEKQGDYPTYVSSRFAAPTKKGSLSEDQVDEVVSSATDLESVYNKKTYDELKEVLNEHFYCNSGGSSDTPTTTSNWSQSKPQQSTPAPAQATKSESDLDSTNPLDDDKVKELLEGLE